MGLSAFSAIPNYSFVSLPAEKLLLLLVFFKKNWSPAEKLSQYFFLLHSFVTIDGKG
jgi:hypothetical protein